MTPYNPLTRFLGTDPADVGSGETLALLEVYVDLLLDGGDAEGRYPSIVAHLKDCASCAEDLAGMLAGARQDRERRLGRPSLRPVWRRRSAGLGGRSLPSQ
jgi:hypothetical protein